MVGRPLRAGKAVWVARHGNRADFVNPAWHRGAQRPHDPELSPDGVEQARELGRRLRGAGIRHIFASPFLRTVETASYVADALDLSVKVERGVCEWLNPEWFTKASGWLPVPELARRFPRVDAGFQSLVNPAFPERDERADCWLRACRAARLLAGVFAEDLLIVSHGAPMMGIVHGLLGESPEPAYGLCSFVKLVWNGRGWESAGNGNGGDARQGTTT